MRAFISYLLFYLFLFSLHFVFLPIRIRALLALYGLYQLYRNYHYIRLSRKERNNWRFLIYCVLLFFGTVILSTIINVNFDSEFFKYPVQIVLSLTSAFGLIAITSKLLRTEFTMEKMLKVIITISVFECLLTVILHINPSIRNVLMNLLNVNAMTADAIEKEEFNRMTGLGAKFFGGGVFMALTIFYISLIINREAGLIKKFGYLFALVVVLIIGSAIARTTLVGLLGFITVFFIPSANKQSKGYDKIVLASSIVLVSIISFSIFKKYLEENPLFEVAMKRAFSVVYVFEGTGEMQAKETMVGGYTTPDNTKTWILGDAQMVDPKDPELSRYKGIDIGIWELIWGYGIVGLFFYGLVQYAFCRLTHFRRLEYIVLFLLWIAFMNKGPVTYDLYLSLFIMLPIYQNIERHKKERALLIQRKEVESSQI